MTDFNSLKTESRNLKSANIDKMSALEIARLINEEDKHPTGCRRYPFS